MKLILKQKFSLIITVVDNGFSETVVNASRENGAEGATIIKARGTGVHETDSVLGVVIQPEKEVVLTLIKKQDRKKVMSAIVKANKLNQQGQGICFSLPLEEVAGVAHLFQLLKPQKKKLTKNKNKKTNNSNKENKIEEQQKVENKEQENKNENTN